MSRLTNVFGVISILAGISLLGAEVTYVFWGSPEGATSLTRADYIESILFFVGAILLVLTSVGLYLYQMEKVGRFGLVAFLIACVGSILMVTSDFMALFGRPFMMEAGLFEPSGSLMTGFIINFMTYFVGWLLLGIVTAIYGVLPRLAGISIAVGALAVFFVGELAQQYRIVDLLVWIPWYGAYVWLGIAMLTGKNKPREEQAAVPSIQPTLATN